jgi:serine/threonine protein kinase
MKLEDLVPIRELGKGSTSTVQLARNAVTGQLFAIKSLHALPGSDQRKQAFRELRFLHRCDSEHLTRLHAAQCSENRVHLALEWLSAGSIARLRANGTVPDAALAAVLAQALRGLACRAL